MATKLVNTTKHPHSFRYLKDDKGNDLPEVRLGIPADAGITGQPQPEVEITAAQLAALKKRPVFQELESKNQIIVKAA